MRRRQWMWVGILAALTWSGAASAYVHVTASDDTPIHWESSCVPWFMHAGSFGATQEMHHGLPYEAALDVTQSSFDTWNQQLQQYVRFQGQGASCYGEVGTPPWPGLENIVRLRTSSDPWPYAARTVGLTSVSYNEATGRIMDADIDLNAQDYTFSLTGESAAYDFESSLTHEVGHVLGLNHSSQLLATMFEKSSPGELHKRSLHDDDIAGVEANHPVSYLPADTLCVPLAERFSLTAPSCPPPPDDGCRAGGKGNLHAVLLLLGLALVYRRTRRLVT